MGVCYTLTSQSKGEGPILREISGNLWLRCFAVVTLVSFVGWALNQYVYPSYVGVFPPAREIATVGTSAGALATAVISQVAPQFVRHMRYMKVAIVLFCSGVMGVAVGLLLENAVLLSCFAFIANAARSSLVASSFVILIYLGTRKVATCVACAFVVSYAARIVGVLIPSVMGIAVWAALPFVVTWCAWPGVRLVASQVGGAPSASDLALTEPRSFLPYGHVLFVVFFVFELASGFSLTFNASSGVPLFVIGPLIPLAIVAMQAVARSDVGPADTLYVLAALLVVAGALSLTVPFMRGTPIANSLLLAGSDCFTILAYYVIAALGRRNVLQSLAVSAWGHFLIAVGTLGGTSLGYAFMGWVGRGGDDAALASAVAVFAFVAFNILVMRGFSFEATVRSIEDVPNVAHEMPESKSEMDEVGTRCSSAAQRFGLTVRETEVLQLLARGRNVPYIEEELVISRNTVKTHIKHIYQKLNVHSQQELIDLVETS